MADRHRMALEDGRTVRVVFTSASDGDFQVLDPASDLDERRRRIVDAPWSWLRQVHGDRALRVDRPGLHAGDEGDALWTTATGCPISVTTADCAPVVLVAEGGVATIHAGWRGLVAGIVERTAAALRSAAGEPVATLLGPCIGPSAYEFGSAELARVAERYGPDVVGTTTAGTPALDVPTAVVEACRIAGWPPPERPACTSDPSWFSHRSRGDVARQVAVAWIEGPEGRR